MLELFKAICGFCIFAMGVTDIVGWIVAGRIPYLVYVLKALLNPSIKD